MWKEFLTGCGTDASPTVYQHVTDTVFKDIVSIQLPVAAQMEGSTHHDEVQLDYQEKYVEICGWLCHKGITPKVTEIETFNEERTSCLLD